MVTATSILALLLCLCTSHVWGKSFLQSLDAGMRGKDKLGYDIVVKRTESNVTRLVFVAGLEGTGHHALRSFFDVCEKASVVVPEKIKSLPTVKFPCEGEYKMSQSFMLFDHKHHRMGGLWGTSNAHAGKSNDFQGEITSVHMRMAHLAKLTSPHLSILGLSYGNGAENLPSGMHSYPNYDGKDKPLDVPDVTMLAALSESAGLDLRILILQRKDVSNMLMSYARRFDLPVHKEALVMLNAMSSLYSQLQLLDRRFFHCVDYEELLQMKGKQSGMDLVNFIHPVVLQKQQEQLFAVVSADRKKEIVHQQAEKQVQPNAGHADAQLEYLLWRLKRQQALLDALCAKKEQ